MGEEIDRGKILVLLNNIEDSLGHYLDIGGPAPPYIKTNDKAIRDNVCQIRAEVKD